MKTKYKTVKLNKSSKMLLNYANEIIEIYQQQGYQLTLRQLYYQLVSRDKIPNRVQEYAKLSVLLVKGRMGGLIDWNAIEDRLRKPKLPYYVVDIEDALQDTINTYRLDRMEGQDNYIEVWVEKDALSNVLSVITRRYHIRLMVNRGYSSCTAMHDAYLRFRHEKICGKQLYILYLGDHDPSGLDMIRDIKKRQSEFGLFINVKHVGITAEQIEKYNPPPNPAKITDPRAKWYISEYGHTSWEVDALPPNILNEILIENIENLIDLNKYENVMEREEIDIEKLKLFIKNNKE